MADNVPITAGSGTNVATDDVSGVHHQKVKLETGAADAANLVEPPDADAKAAASLLPSGPMVWNGTGWDRVRAAPNSAGALTAGVVATALFRYSGGSQLEPAVSAAVLGDGVGGTYFGEETLRVYNGSSYDRARGDVANGLDVDVTRVQAGDVDHDAVNTAKVVQVGGHATSEKAPVAEPAAVAAADRTRPWLGLRGETVTRERTVSSYSAVGRLASVGARGSLSFLQVANTDKQWLTLHHAASSTKLVRIRYIGFILVDVAVASILNFDVRLITAAPAVGNPAITPAPHNQANAATECTSLALPTTAATMAATPSLALQEFDSAILAPPTAPPGYNLGKFDLWPQGPNTWEDEQPIELRAGVLEGIAIVVRAVTGSTLQGIPIIRYTEETP